MRDFKQLRIWKKGFEIAVNTLKLIQTFPTSEKYGLSHQISGAAVSISSNIAEGSSRKSEKDYKRFLEISLGSSFELETQLLIAEASNYGEQELRNQLLTDVDVEQKMLMGFIKSFRI